MDMFSLSMEMLKKYRLCDNCLGRQFAQLLTSTSNKQRGKSIRYVCAMYIDTQKEFYDANNNFTEFSFNNVKIRFDKEKKECFLCFNIFTKVDEIAQNVLRILEGYEYETYLVGVVPKPEMIRNEEIFWEEFGAEFSERLKEELSREIGKKIHELTGKEVDFKNADITILIDLRKNSITKNVRSLYIYGRYNKYKPMPQTKWLCGFCHGVGCDKCSYKGKKYDYSVEELIGSVLLKYSKGTGTSFHGAGREDVDALCYGWREFIIEIEEPKIRSFNLSEVEREINDKYKEYIEVKDLRVVDSKEVKKLKAKRDNKIYEVVVECEEKLTKEDIDEINKIKDLVINQQTPKRVEHRRADKVRRRKIFYVKVLNHKDKDATLEIKAEAGTYIKEFVNGDDGRTRPSISSLVGKRCEVKELIVKGFEPVERE